MSINPPNMAQRIAVLLSAIDNCKRNKNSEWLGRHQHVLDAIMKRAPSGSGIDCGTTLSLKSTPDTLVFTASYHHMNDIGFYTRWSEYRVTVRASLLFGLDIAIRGRDANGTKDYLHDVYAEWLHSIVGADVMADLYSAPA